MSAQHCASRAAVRGQVTCCAWRVLDVTAICCTGSKAVGASQVCFFIKQAAQASWRGHCYAAKQHACTACATCVPTSCLGSAGATGMSHLHAPCLTQLAPALVKVQAAQQRRLLLLGAPALHAFSAPRTSTERCHAGRQASAGPPCSRPPVAISLACLLSDNSTCTLLSHPHTSSSA